jgi:hypothetical protein
MLNSVQVHPQLSQKNRLPMDVVPMDFGSLALIKGMNLNSAQ